MTTQLHTPITWGFDSKTLNLKVFTLIFLLLLSVSVAADDFVQLSHGDLIHIDSTTPPDALNNWQPMELPYHNRNRPMDNHGPVVWFRFPVTQPDTPAAAYLWRYQMTAQFFLNDVPLGGTTEAPGWATTYWNHPLLVNIPNSAWQPDDNYLYLRVAGRGFGPISSPVLLGDHLQLMALWQDRIFLQVEVSQWSFFLCLLLATLAVWLWRIRPQETLYLYYAGACLSWSVVLWYLWGAHFPGPLFLFLIVMHLCIDLTMLFLVMFVNQAMNLRLTRLQPAMIACWVLSIIVYLFISKNYFFYVAYGMHFIGLLLLIFIISRGAFMAFKKDTSASIWIVMTLAGIFLFGLHDTLTFLFANDEEWITSAFWSQFIGVLILLCFFGHLGQRFVSALNETDLLNRELENRVALKEQELEKVYEQTLQLEVAKSNLQQREQIYRDLHDDVGSKLVSIIQAPEETKSASYARAALENLRAAIFQAKYPDLPLARLLEDCREEATLRADAIGKQLLWTQRGELDEFQLPGDANYHLTRIIREAISNSLKFGLAAPISVDIDLTGDGLTMSVSNEVFDSAPALAGFSNGLTNIRFRAEAIGAEVDWQAADAEMRFTLRLPFRGTLAPEKQSFT